MSFTKVAPAGIGTEPGSSILIGDSLLHSTGIDIGSSTGVGVTIRQHGDATFTGIITASAFFGDGSGLEGVSSSGIGTALNDDDTNVLNKIYYVNQELSIGSTVTVNHPDTGTASYTHYQDLVVKNDADFIVADGDTFIPDILGITTSTLAASAATGGRIRAGTITNAGANGAVNFPNGLTGTAGTFTGAITATSGTITGNLGVAGVLTYEDVTNVDSVGVITARQGIHIDDGITHIGDTNTKIRFPSADTITAETGGSERTRISSDGHLGINTDFTGSQLWRAGKRLEIFGGSGNVTGELHLGANRGDGTQSVGSINFFDNTQDSTHRHIALIETDKSGTTSNKRGGTMVFYTKTDNVAAPTEKLRIHATGAVTKPLQPSFGAYGNASWTTINSNSGAVPVLPNVSHNVGSSYNTGNGTFTCPVAGLYQVMFHTLVSTDDDSQNNNTRSFDVFFQIGGSNFARHHVKRGYQNDGDVQVTMDMTCTEIFTINTTVSLYFYANAGNQRWYGAHTYFGVTLLS